MTTSAQLLALGYVAAPNNIHSLPGSAWYACGPGKPTVSHNEEIRLIDDKLSVWTTKYYNRPDGSGFMFSISGIVTELSGIDALIEYCVNNGRQSEGGIGPSSIYNVWD